MAPSGNNKALTSHDKEIRRGRAIVKEVLRIREKGQKLKIGWSKKGKPIKPHKQKFVRYIGMTAREKVPIIYNSWEDVPEQIKNNIWSDVESAFLVDDIHRKYVLQVADRLWTQFRSNLSKCVTDDAGNMNEHPPQTYSCIIPDDDWKKFVAQHVDEPSKTLSDGNLQSLLKPAYEFMKSCTRDASLEQNAIEEEGSYVTSLPRHVLWRAGHVNKQGLIDNPNVQQVWDKCEALLKSVSQKETQECGRQDIVDGALNILEQPGRVRDVEFGVSQRDNFKSEKRSRRENFGKVERVEVLVKTPQEQVNTLLQMQMQQQTLQKQRNLPPTNGRDSCMPLPLAANIPKGPTQCLLCLAVPYFRTVGTGTVYNLPGDTLHNRPLPLNHVRVSVDVIFEGSAPLPVPNEDAELFSVENAVGTCVAWPINLIQFDLVTPTQSKSEGKTTGHTKKVVASSKKQAVLQPSVGDGATKLPFYCKLLYVYAQKVLTNSSPLRIPMEEAVLNYDCVEHIGLDEVNQVVHHQQLGASVICVYIRYLYEQMLVPDNLTEKFSFVLPHQTSLNAEQQTHYIVDALTAQAQLDKLFLAPYNIEEHWVLIVINASEGKIYYLDPLNGDPRHQKEMKTLFDTALKIYRVTTSATVPGAKRSNIQWDNIKCPRQTNNIDCGYYILKFMKDIITHNEPMIPLEYFQDCRCSFYSNDQLDEVREEWASYVLDNFC
ncbi:uncharacterized protein LOC130738591 [Lotus japonicus]|uniref:uncharacterized protein LOC130738591 n=1 Tax=Lotus japonicus TaxID=34305 RepID=UPI002588168A|nr:uncharacterized protein LOC130738591 [Lotus japonicus]XP_057446636.1 uncharacterized protein LOC130738591 [Lotus japonicus]XP_057446637.1 uncharacterized protein LOC130738591 [Lotus japonicus]